MEFRFHKAQAAKLLLLVLSLTLIPFVSTSLRPSYLYFLLNILIIALGYESGIHHALVEPEPVTTAGPAALPENRAINGSVKQAHEGSQGRPVVVMADQTPTAAEKVVTATKAPNMKRAPPVPSLFFIGSCDGDGDVAEAAVEEDEEDVFEAVFKAMGEISARELFERAERLIGKFHGPMKIQREESGMKTHGFYHKTF